MHPKSKNIRFSDSAATYDLDVRAIPTCAGKATKGRALSKYRLYEIQKQYISETASSYEDYEHRIAALAKRLGV